MCRAGAKRMGCVRSAMDGRGALHSAHHSYSAPDGAANCSADASTNKFSHEAEIWGPGVEFMVKFPHYIPNDLSNANYTKSDSHADFHTVFAPNNTTN